MRTCSLLTADAVDILRESYAIDNNNKIIDKVVFAYINAELKKDFLKMYSKKITGLGKVVNNVIKVNQSNLNFELNVQKEAAKKYPGVDLKTNIADIGGGEFVSFNSKFTESVALGYVPDSPVFTIQDSKGNFLRKSTLKGLKRGSTGIATYIKDLQGNKLNLVAGLSMTHRRLLNIKFNKGVAAEKAISGALTRFGNEESFLQSRVINSSTLSKEAKELNDIFDLVLEKTDTNYVVKMERGVERNALGVTDGGVISISPFNIGASINDLSLNDTLGKVYLHEKAHIVTMGLLNTSDIYQRQMEKVYAFVKDSSLQVEGNAMDNLTEFLAEAISNPVFQDQLKSINYKNSSKDIWSTIIKYIKDSLNKFVSGHLQDNALDEVFAATAIAIKAHPSTTPLNGPVSEAVELLANIDMQGNYAGSGTVAEVYALAETIGFTYKPGKGFFYTTYEGDERRAAREDITYIVSDNYANYTKALLYGAGDLRDLKGDDTYEGPPLLVYNKDGVNPFDLESINSIEDLRVAQSMITPPAQAASKKYEIKSTEFYRTTASLGFSIPESERSLLLENAAAIGNFQDELGKRIFRGDDPSNLTYEKIAEFTKDEARDLAIREQRMDAVEFEIAYQNPVGEEGYNQLVEGLVATKADLIANDGVKKFHTDIVVWDPDTKVAGEVDILSEHTDGTFTVIDLKSRRKGLQDYNEPEYGKNFNDKSKHTMQTNTYSNMMAKMGFTLNPPKIIMSQPIYPDNTPVGGATFKEIEGSEIIITRTLKRREGNVADYNVSSQGVNNPLLQAAHEAKMSNYNNWLNSQKKVQEDIKAIKPENFTRRDKQLLQDKFVSIKNSLIGYKNISKETLNSSVLSDNLNDLLAKIEVLAKVDIDEDLFAEQLDAAENFFMFAAEQLQELNIILKQNQGTVEEKKEVYLQIKNYRGVFKTAQELFEVLEVLHEGMNLGDIERYTNVKIAFRNFSGINDILNTDLNIALRNLFKETVLDTYLGSNGEIKLINDLEKEARAKFGKDKEKIAEYVNKERRDPNFIQKIYDAAEVELHDLITSPSRDVSKAAFNFNSDMSINNKFVQIFHKMVMNAEQKFSSIANDEVVALSKLHSELGLSKSEVEELIGWDSNNNAYLISDYDIEFLSLQEEFKQRRKDLLKKIDVADTEELRLLRKEELDLSGEYTTWLNANTVGKERRVPIDKWKTDYTKFSEAQLEALNIFKGITLKNNTRIGVKSLIKETFVDGASYFRLPGVLRTTFGHAISGDLAGVAKKSWEQATKVELDDTEEGSAVEANKEVIRTAYTGLDGKPVYQVPIFFRGRPGDKQNTDLFTIYALELQNGIRYSVDKKLAIDATIFLDTVHSSKFFATVGMDLKKVKSMFLPKDSKEVDTLSGDASVVAMSIEKMMKNRIFAMTQEFGGEIMGKDINRVIGTISAYTAFASMSFKLLGSANNWVTGNVAASLEAAGGEFYGAKTLTKAKAIYYNNIPGIVGDIGAPVKRNFVNQLTAIFDAQGDRSILNNEFERTNWATRNLKAGTALSGYSMGEHEIHATIMLAILEDQKVLDSKGNYLDKSGEITSSRASAASVLDAFSQDEAGIVKLAEWAEYSEFDTVNKLSETGLTSMRDLIKDRVTRTQGAYDKHMQSDLNRQWYGKLFFQFKKHIAPQTLNRFRGLKHSMKDTVDLEDYQKYFNYSAKTEEYGYYTSFFRFLSGVVKQEKLNIAGYMKAGSNSWEDMTTHERANVKKTVTELSYIMGTFLLASMAAAAADDDDDALWGLVYLLRRQTNESGLNYLNPSENWRVLNSPMSAMSKLNGISDMLKQIVEPGEDYESGVNRGDNKLRVKASRVFMLDRLDQIEEGYNKRMHGNLTN